MSGEGRAELLGHQIEEHRVRSVRPVRRHVLLHLGREQVGEGTARIGPQSDAVNEDVLGRLSPQEHTVLLRALRLISDPDNH